MASVAANSFVDMYTDDGHTRHTGVLKHRLYK